MNFWELDLAKQRPYLEDGKSYYLEENGPELSEIEAAITKQEWETLDKIVDVAVHTKAIFTQHVYQVAKYVIPKLPKAKGDQRLEEGLTKLQSTPLLITHSDVSLNLYWLNRSREKNCPIGTQVFEASGKRVGEALESMLLGTKTTEGLYGILNHRNRITCIDTVDFAIKQLQDKRFFGPYTILCNQDDLNKSYWVTTEPKIERVFAVEGLSIGQFVVIQLGQDTIRLVVGQKPILYQTELFEQEVEDAETKEKRMTKFQGFKIAACIVPQIREDYEGNVAIAVCTYP